ncbi:hypothetical protein HDU88_004647 [Geranomyces variabilis]|nr:hypothetical protein HDU88_004647 [Geranomyces variabilis]
MPFISFQKEDLLKLLQYKKPSPYPPVYSPKLSQLFEYLACVLEELKPSKVFAGILFVGTHHMHTLRALITGHETLGDQLIAAVLGDISESSKHSATVQQFNVATSVNTLLIAPVKATEGLDITRCTHFLLMDSTREGLNPCLYLQCCARAYYLDATVAILADKGMGNYTRVRDLQLYRKLLYGNDGNNQALVESSDNSVKMEGIKLSESNNDHKDQDEAQSQAEAADPRVIDRKSNTNTHPQNPLLGGYGTGTQSTPKRQHMCLEFLTSCIFNNVIRRLNLCIGTMMRREQDAAPIPFWYHSPCVPEILWTNFANEFKFLDQMRGFDSLYDTDQEQLSKMTGILGRRIAGGRLANNTSERPQRKIKAPQRLMDSPQSSPQASPRGSRRALPQGSAPGSAQSFHNAGPHKRPIDFMEGIDPVPRRNMQPASSGPYLGQMGIPRPGSDQTCFAGAALSLLFPLASGGFRRNLYTMYNAAVSSQTVIPLLRAVRDIFETLDQQGRPRVIPLLDALNNTHLPREAYSRNQQEDTAEFMEVLLDALSTATVNLQAPGASPVSSFTDWSSITTYKCEAPGCSQVTSTRDHHKILVASIGNVLAENGFLGMQDVVHTKAADLPKILLIRLGRFDFVDGMAHKRRDTVKLTKSIKITRDMQTSSIIQLEGIMPQHTGSVQIPEVLDDVDKDLEIVAYTPPPVDDDLEIVAYTPPPVDDDLEIVAYTHPKLRGSNNKPSMISNRSTTNTQLNGHSRWQKPLVFGYNPNKKECTVTTFEVYLTTAKTLCKSVAPCGCHNLHIGEYLAFTAQASSDSLKVTNAFGHAVGNVDALISARYRVRILDNEVALQGQVTAAGLPEQKASIQLYVFTLQENFPTIKSVWINSKHGWNKDLVAFFLNKYERARRSDLPDIIADMKRANAKVPVTLWSKNLAKTDRILQRHRSAVSSGWTEDVLKVLHGQCGDNGAKSMIELHKFSVSGQNFRDIAQQACIDSGMSWEDVSSRILTKEAWPFECPGADRCQRRRECPPIDDPALRVISPLQDFLDKVILEDLYEKQDVLAFGRPAALDAFDSQAWKDVIHTRPAACFRQVGNTVLDVSPPSPVTRSKGKPHGYIVPHFGWMATQSSQ